MMIALEELVIFQILLPKVEDKQNLTHPQSTSPINHVAGLWGFYSLLLTRLLNPSVKIGCIKTKKAVKLPKELNAVCYGITRFTLKLAYSSLPDIIFFTTYGLSCQAFP